MALRFSPQNLFIEKRARALAVVSLTRRDDLIVTEETNDGDVDLWVTLRLDKKVGHREFGVVLQGALSAITAAQADALLRPSLQKLLRSGPFPFPVVLFFFTMENSEAWYTWIAEPIVSPKDGFQLVRHGNASCYPLDDQAIDKIVEDVDRWYDAFFAKAIREVPAPKTTGSLT